MSIEDFLELDCPGYSPNMTIYLIRSVGLPNHLSRDPKIIHEAEVYLKDPKLLPDDLEVDKVPAYGFFHPEDYSSVVDYEHAINHPEQENFYSLSDFGPRL